MGVPRVDYELDDLVSTVTEVLLERVTYELDRSDPEDVAAALSDFQVELDEELEDITSVLADLIKMKGTEALTVQGSEDDD